MQYGRNTHMAHIHEFNTKLFIKKYYTFAWDIFVSIPMELSFSSDFILVTFMSLIKKTQL